MKRKEINTVAICCIHFFTAVQHLTCMLSIWLVVQTWLFHGISIPTLIIPNGGWLNRRLIPEVDHGNYKNPLCLKAQQKKHGVHVPNKTQPLKPAEVWCNLSSAEMVPPGVILSRLELLESSSCRCCRRDLMTIWAFGDRTPRKLESGK